MYSCSYDHPHTHTTRERERERERETDNLSNQVEGKHGNLGLLHHHARSVLHTEELIMGKILGNKIL